MTNIAQASWFIGMMVAIAVLILFLIIVCFIKRSRGEKYHGKLVKKIILEPRHDKTCLREFLTRPDTNRPAQPQKLAEISAIESRAIILSKQ